MDRSGRRLNRRAVTRMLMTGVVGLGLLPARLFGDDDTGTLGKWARLGRLWRAMGPHWRGEAGEGEGAERAFDGLKTELEQALDDVEATEEFRALCVERWHHIRRSRYSLATCYDMTHAGFTAMRARGDVEKQVQELEKLAAEAKLSAKALTKAARGIAPAAEYLTLAYRAWRGETRDEEAARALEETAEDYAEGRLTARKAATQAAEKAVGMTEAE